MIYFHPEDYHCTAAKITSVLCWPWMSLNLTKPPLPWSTFWPSQLTDASASERPRVFWVLSGNVIPMAQVSGPLPCQAPKPMLSFLRAHAKSQPFFSLPLHIRPTFWIHAIDSDHKRIIDEKESDLFSYTQMVDGMEREMHHFRIMSQSFHPVSVHPSYFRFLSLPP